MEEENARLKAELAAAHELIATLKIEAQTCKEEINALQNTVDQLRAAASSNISAKIKALEQDNKASSTATSGGTKRFISSYISKHVNKFDQLISRSVSSDGRLSVDSRRSSTATERTSSNVRFPQPKLGAFGSVDRESSNSSSGSQGRHRHSPSEVFSLQTQGSIVPLLPTTVPERRHEHSAAFIAPAVSVAPATSVASAAASRVSSGFSVASDGNGDHPDSAGALYKQQLDRFVQEITVDSDSDEEDEPGHGARVPRSTSVLKLRSSILTHASSVSPTQSAVIPLANSPPSTLLLGVAPSSSVSASAASPPTTDSVVSSSLLAASVVEPAVPAAVTQAAPSSVPAPTTPVLSSLVLAEPSLAESVSNSDSAVEPASAASVSVSSPESAAHPLGSDQPSATFSSADSAPQSSSATVLLIPTSAVPVSDSVSAPPGAIDVTSTPTSESLSIFAQLDKASQMIERRRSSCLLPANFSGQSRRSSAASSSTKLPSATVVGSSAPAIQLTPSASSVLSSVASASPPIPVAAQTTPVSHSPVENQSSSPEQEAIAQPIVKSETIETQSVAQSQPQAEMQSEPQSNVAVQAVIQPVAQPASQPAAQSAIQPAIQAVAQPTVPSLAQITLQPATGSMAESSFTEASVADTEDGNVGFVVEPDQSPTTETTEPVLTPEEQAVLDIAKELKEQQDKLPLLVAQLDKKSPSGFQMWQKRFVAVYDYNIYYSRDPISSDALEKEDQKTEPSKKAGNVETSIHCLPLVVVNAIFDVPRSREFCIQARDPHSGKLRDYRFRAPTEREKSVWVKGLNDHRNHLLAMLRWVSLNKSSAVEIDWN